MAHEYTENRDSDQYDLAVVGAGPSGLIAALAAAEMGLATVLVGPPANRTDRRTAALMAPSIALLRRFGVWERLAESAAPLAAIRLVDATAALIRAPEVTFHASEIGLEAFGYNIGNSVLTQILEETAAERLQRVSSAGVIQVTHAANGVCLATAEGRTIEAKLVAAADGRQSGMREAVKIPLSRWQYEQSAVVTTFAHSRDHGGISTEFNRRTGPLTVVPMHGRQSSLVWVETPAEAARLSALDDAAFGAELARNLHGLLGTLGSFSPRQVFGLQGQTAKSLARDRVALIGEAGHVMPPIGAQGLNLSFRDAATIAEVAAEAKAAGEDIGCERVLQRYEALRRPDVMSRVWTVDLLNRSLLSPYLPVHLLRGAGLFALSVAAPLRRHLMREGIGQTAGLPHLMRPADAALDKARSPLDGVGSGRA